MREILFRGKRVDSGEWVYSSFIMQDKEHKVLSAEVELFDGEMWRAVDPETVGEYTGLKDKDGRRIFEGDIVKYNLWDDKFDYCEVKFGYFYAAKVELVSVNAENTITARRTLSESEICDYLVQLIEYMRGQGSDTIIKPKTGERWTFGKEEQ